MEQACDGNPDVPPLNHGRLGWFVDRLEQHKVQVAKETVRKWFAGETRPRHPAMKALAQILKIDEGWLSAGRAPDLSEA
ncbi:XRE family transcriptional regulator, partial [Mesorhizobium sp. M2D.F.Ca.ET.145.01.1.1]